MGGSGGQPLRERSEDRLQRRAPPRLAESLRGEVGKRSEDAASEETKRVRTRGRRCQSAVIAADEAARCVHDLTGEQRDRRGSMHHASLRPSRERVKLSCASSARRRCRTRRRAAAGERHAVGGASVRPRQVAGIIGDRRDDRATSSRVLDSVSSRTSVTGARGSAPTARHAWLSRARPRPGIAVAVLQNCGASIRPAPRKEVPHGARYRARQGGAAGDKAVGEHQGSRGGTEVSA